MKAENLKLYMARLAGLIIGCLALLCFVYISSAPVLATNDNFEESPGKLKASFETSDLASISEDMMFLLNEDGKSVWQFIGPETREDLDGDCNILNWSELDPARIKEVEATVVKEGDKVTEVHHVFDLPSDATNAMGYCFAVPITNMAAEEGWLFQYRKLAEQTPTETAIPGTIKITESATLEGTDIPSSIILTPSSEELNLIAWGYAVIEDAAMCRVPEALNVTFAPLSANDRGQVELKLNKEMAEQVLCIQAQNVENGDFLFSAYVIPASPATDSGGSTTAVVIVVLAVLAVVGIGVFIMRSKKDQDQDS